MVAGLITHQEHKKSAGLHQAAESSVEIFAFGRSLFRTSTLWVKTPCRLRWQVVGFGFPSHS
jgi:hypothetical protein